MVCSRRTVKGGSNFAAAYHYDDLVASPCTSVELQADKSNYWMVCTATTHMTSLTTLDQPQLYWITKPGDPNTTFLSMNTNNRFYYFLGRNVGRRSYNDDRITDGGKSVRISIPLWNPFRRACACYRVRYPYYLPSPF